jgi:3-methyl-2-oxobutanoate hydroxymethyltransferase
MPTPVRTRDLKEQKRRGEKIAMLTAYDANMARLLDRAGVDALLVGDSVGMVMLGYQHTVPVTLDAMIHHTAAVARERSGRSSSPTCHSSPIR